MSLQLFLCRNSIYPSVIPVYFVVPGDIESGRKCLIAAFHQIAIEQILSLQRKVGAQDAPLVVLFPAHNFIQQGCKLTLTHLQLRKNLDHIIQPLPQEDRRNTYFLILCISSVQDLEVSKLLLS